MIPRYTRPAMARIWADANRLRIWFLIEAYACEALAQLGLIPVDAAQAVWAKGDKPYTAERVARIEILEREIHHDVIAFLTELSESVGPAARFVHQGMTSSDVLDTCYAVQCKQAAELLQEDINRVLKACKRRALEHKHTLCIGRSHGIHAEPTTLGLKFASFYAEFARNRRRLWQAQEEIATCSISGAVGTFAHIDPFVEQYVAGKLGLKQEPIATQVIPRDRHAVFFTTLSVIASSVERFAIEIRHLQRTEVREVEEDFAPGQKGSSAMPHKRNPILTENLTGLARLVRSAGIPALENVALWHERDISHSSVERVIGPDATIVLDFALDRLVSVLDGLVIHQESIASNLEKLCGLIYSQQVLLSLIQAGMSREEAYQVVQRNAMAAWKSQTHFLDLLSEDPDVEKHLSYKDLKTLFNASFHTRYVEAIMKRVFEREL
ncbi:Adenylosuccinate lyase [invertebrate metagenome]|uniref:Adenylosuccinate lyase n=1 Tax=invertebrate metagenome TaxID=1711999 RepID=A0A484H8B7_9ZZZZ